MREFHGDAKLQRFPMPPAWNAQSDACFVELAQGICYFPRDPDDDIPVRRLVGVRRLLKSAERRSTPPAWVRLLQVS
jgi:hypothetical protein